MTLESVKAMIDHTLLRADATDADIRRLCDEARNYSFFAICLNPGWVPLAAACLRGSGVCLCTVAGFPLGATFPEAKAHEAELTIRQGAHEVDMVINIGAVKDHRHQLVARDVATVLRVCRSGGALLKVIIETAYLTQDEKITVCEIIRDLGADFVKTSTGFGPAGARSEDVALMRRVVGGTIGVKAAGGIRDWAAFKSMVEAGANRIGTSSGVKILQEAAGAIEEV